MELGGVDGICFVGLVAEADRSVGVIFDVVAILVMVLLLLLLLR